MALDGSNYSHAAIWSGAGVIESTTPQVIEWPLEQSLREHPRAVVDVYRHCDARIGPLVVNEARRFLGRPYSYGDLFLGALLVTCSKWSPRHKDQLTFLTRGAALNAFLDLDDESPDELVTCVELVVRAYQNCGVRIRIDPSVAGHLDFDLLFAGITRFAVDSKNQPGKRRPRGTWSHARQQLADKLTQILIARRSKAAAIAGPWAPLASPQTGQLTRAPLPAAGFDWGANLVTPRHLALSPDLEFKGRLYEGNPATCNPA